MLASTETQLMIVTSPSSRIVLEQVGMALRANRFIKQQEPSLASMRLGMLAPEDDLFWTWA
jgi:hypothetical protein